MSTQPSIKRYVGRRAAHAVPLLFIIVTVMFALIQMAPGDPTTALTGNFPATDAYVEEVAQKYGLDRPLIERYGVYLGRLVQGDLGYSLAKRQPVADVLLSRMGPTALLTGSALIGAALFGIAAGVMAARKPYSRMDNAMSILGILGYSIPVFWLAQLLLILFAVQLGILPAQGMSSIRGSAGPLQTIADVGLHLLLPAAALSVRFFIVDMRITRASMIEVMDMEYITTAHAKGQAPRPILFRHALPNSLLPVVTVIGVDMGTLLTGSALVEIIFGWPGIGSLLLESTNTRDHPTLMGIFLIMALTAVLANLITDIVYAYLDPRIRY